MKDRLVNYVTNRNLESSQHGLLEGRSCLTPHVDLLKLITQGAESYWSMLIILLDMSKVFYLLSHSRILARRRTYGRRNLFISWLFSSLSDRVHAFNINGCYFQPSAITSGVTQGSILGSPPFLLYINDISNVIRHSTPFLFLNDIKTIYSFEIGSFYTNFAPIDEDLKSTDN